MGILEDNYQFLENISEEIIYEKTKNYVGYESEIEYFQKISNVIFNNNHNDEVLDILEISGRILLYGLPGVGKTSLVYCLSKYILEKYGIESYKISMPALIESQLGRTTRNIKMMAEEIKFISDKYGAVIILDEIDRLSVSRSNENELSEMKRALLELMDFLDEIKHTRKLMIIGITNFEEVLDKGLRRRFDFQQEIKPTIESVLLVVEQLNNVLGLMNDKKMIKSIAQAFVQQEPAKHTIDYVKKQYKHLYIQCIDASTLTLNTELFKNRLIKLTNKDGGTFCQ